jgi:hypothetical protein
VDDAFHKKSIKAYREETYKEEHKKNYGYK